MVTGDNVVVVVAGGVVVVDTFAGDVVGVVTGATEDGVVVGVGAGIVVLGATAMVVVGATITMGEAFGVSERYAFESIGP